MSPTTYVQTGALYAASKIDVIIVYELKQHKFVTSNDNFSLKLNAFTKQKPRIYYAGAFYIYITQIRGEVKKLFGRIYFTGILRFPTFVRTEIYDWLNYVY